MTTDTGSYQNNDTWALSRASTERINRLNDSRRQFVRLEMAANSLLREYYQDDIVEKQLAMFLKKVVTIAHARIIGIDEATTDALAEHERIMQKLLTGD